jgi:3-hydroxyacyl-[acyl-carrier-protein] dehydratase
MIASGNDIFKFIPQRPPIVMVDSLFSVSDKKTISGLTIHKSNIFIENDCFNESGLLENIAQTAAAGVGYQQVTNGQPVNLGYIAAIKSLSINTLPKVASVLQTTIEIINEVLDITIVNAKVRCNDEIVAECEMRIFIKSS